MSELPEGYEDYIQDQYRVAVTAMQTLWPRRYEDDLRAYRAGMKAQAEKAAWQPIETAPKDGTDILLAKIAECKALLEFNREYIPPFVWWCVKGFWSKKWNNWNDGIEPSGLAGPNFWMPLPSADAISKASEQS
ncbi:MAG TPA: hypothetical protein ENK38_05170 [Gammaproteobacteria bacterium]|nr:hypothetical protein [Gammaproteobacteria bacterium]